MEIRLIKGYSLTLPNGSQDFRWLIIDQPPPIIRIWQHTEDLFNASHSARILDSR